MEENRFTYANEIEERDEALGKKYLIANANWVAGQF